MATKKTTEKVAKAAETIKNVSVKASEELAKVAEAATTEVKATAEKVMVGTKKATETTATEVKATAKKVKNSTKKATEATATEVKATAKKAKDAVTTTAKKAVTASNKAKTETYIQFAGNEISESVVLEKVLAAFKGDAKKAPAAKSVKIYIKPEENAAYYVINDDVTGKVDLF